VAKSCPKFWTTTVIFTKLHKVNNSPNLVTLLPTLEKVTEQHPCKFTPQATNATRSIEQLANVNTYSQQERRLEKLPGKTAKPRRDASF
jgi:hypothetical protein